MEFTQKSAVQQYGKGIGFLAGYALFTTMLFLILTFTHKIPANWSYLHIVAITALVTCLGACVQRVLK